MTRSGPGAQQVPTTPSAERAGQPTGTATSAPQPPCRPGGTDPRSSGSPGLPAAAIDQEPGSTVSTGEGGSVRLIGRPLRSFRVAAAPAGSPGQPTGRRRDYVR